MLRLNEHYRTRCGNIVQLVHREYDPRRPELEAWRAKAVHNIEGHEAWSNWFHTYNAKGKWLNEEGQTVANCIHDLKEHVEGFK